MLARLCKTKYTCDGSCTRMNRPSQLTALSVWSAGMCYLGVAVSGREPTVVKVHADGHDPLDRVKHKEYFAQEALKLVLRCI